MSKYGVISGPYFPAFGLNKERYFVFLRIESECGKIRTRNNSVFGHISQSKCSTLKIFDPKLPIKITCDASSIGLRATLKQCIDNVWCPIAFASRTLGKSERNYCHLEKETLSIVLACKKFHHYIYGQQFLL